jgi:hypothetical protein
MRPIERLLSAHGYRVLNLGYPSRSASIPELARRVASEIAQWAPAEPLDFVTHSLGGILIRQAVAAGHLSAERMRRVVMLGPPNTGSELADQLPRWPVFGPVYRKLTGPAGVQLGTDSSSVPASLPPVPFETGVIAGTRSYNPIFPRCSAAGRRKGESRTHPRRGDEGFCRSALLASAPPWCPVRFTHSSCASSRWTFPVMSFDAQPLDDVLVGAPDPKSSSWRPGFAPHSSRRTSLRSTHSSPKIFCSSGRTGRLATKSQDLEAHATGVVRFREHVPEELRVRRVGAGRRRDEPAGRLAVEVAGAESRHVSTTRVWARDEAGNWRVVGGHVSAAT